MNVLLMHNFANLVILVIVPLLKARMKYTYKSVHDESFDEVMK